MNTTHTPIQDEKGILRFSKGNISYKVVVNSKESRLECIKQLRENTGRNFRWFKETTGNRHWVIYDSDMYEISNECDTNLLGLEKFAYLHYKEESGLEPELPINATSCHCMFYQCSLIKSFTLEKELFDTTNIVTMFGMFSACCCLENLDVSALATPNLVDMAEMFRGCISLKEIDLRNFNTSKVTDMEKLFEGCYSLTKILLTGLDTSNVVDMSYMFYNADNTIKLDLSRFDTSKVETMEAMFSNMYALKYLDVSSFSTERLTNMDAMFDNCVNLVNLDLTSFDTGSVLYMLNTFSGCEQLEEILVSDKWSVCWGIEDGDRTFDGAKKLPNYNHVTTGADKGYDNRCGGYLTFK